MTEIKNPFEKNEDGSYKPTNEDTIIEFWKSLGLPNDVYLSMVNKMDQITKRVEAEALDEKKNS